MGSQPTRLPVVAFSLIAIAMLGLMAAIFLFGFWSNTGRIAGAEHYASRFASVLPFGYAFAAGIVASVNPCGFLMLPAFLGYQLGADARQGQEVEAGDLGRAVLVGVTVTMGFLVLFSVIGLIIASGGHLLIDVFPWAGFGIGVGLTLVGLWLMATGRSVGLAMASRVTSPRGRGLGATFLYGVAYGAVSLSCTLPVFLVVVATSLVDRGVLSSVGQFASYAMGMGAVIIAVSLGAVSLRGAVARGLRSLVPHVHRLSAIFLTGAGVYLVVYWVWLGKIFD